MAGASPFGGFSLSPLSPPHTASSRKNTGFGVMGFGFVNVAHIGPDYPDLLAQEDVDENFAAGVKNNATEDTKGAACSTQFKAYTMH